MKNLSTALLAGALLTSGIAAFQIPARAQSAAPVADFSAAQKTWLEVRDNSDYLDGLIAQRKLDEVHEAAYNLRDSVRMLRGAGAKLGADANQKLLADIHQIDELASDLDENGDNNDRRAVIEKQRETHLALDRIAALFPARTLAPIGAVTASGAIKDPVCRMTVDAATAPARAAFGGQTYYFCSPGDAATFRKSPAKYAALSDEIAFGTPKTFVVALDSDKRARAGQSELLTLTVREKGSPNVVRDFQLVHEKRMHLVVVSDDLTYFSHEHPEIGADGRFRLKWSAPRAGRYFLFADYTPGDGLNQITKTTLTVAGTAAGTTVGAAPKSPHLVADKTLRKTVAGFQISVSPSAPLRAGTPVLLTYSISKNGQPVTDMGKYLGADGHMMAINAAETAMVHTHTVAAGGAVSPAMATPSGPRFTFDLTPQSAGLTKIWAQFQRGEQVITVPFSFDVAPALKGTALAAPPMDGMHMGDMKMDGMPMGASNESPSKSPTQAPEKAPEKAPIAPRKITISLPEGYKNGAATLQKGQPVALTFTLKSDAGCGNTVAVPAAKWRKTLRVGESATLLYTPTQSGALKFACGMGMYRGTMLVK